MKFKERCLTAMLAAMMMLSVIMMAFSSAVPVFAAGETIELVNMHDTGSDHVKVVDGSITDSYGKTYTGNILQFDAVYSARISYDLNGEYEQFNGTIVASTDTSSKAVMDVGIFGDGKLLYELKDYTRQKAAEDVNIDVNGIGTLSIMTTCVDTNYSGSDLYFVNSSFTKSDEPSAYPTRSSLSDLVEIDSIRYEMSDRLFIDSFGNLHKGYARLGYYKDYESYVLYNLDKQYISFTGSIVAGKSTDSDASMNIQIYLDDEEVYNKTNITKTTPQIDFDLDVSNASTLRIKYTGNSGNPAYVYITDTILKVHEHTVSDWVVTKEATCTEDGEKTQTCTECGEVALTSKIPATGHTPDDNWTVTKEATCTELGEKTQKCTVCGEVVNTKKISATGHTSDDKWVVERESTCSKAGEEVQHCTICKEICNTRSIEKIEHTPEDDWEVESEATCLREGKEYKKCTVCGEVTEEQAIPLADHQYNKWKVLSGSIWDTPVVKERTCSVCGHVEHVESNATIWLKPLVIVLLIGAAAVIVFLVVRKKPAPAATATSTPASEPEPETDDFVRCENCGAIVKKGMRFCTSCGNPIEPEFTSQFEAPPAEKVCPRCGAKIGNNSKFCTKCGTKL